MDNYSLDMVCDIYKMIKFIYVVLKKRKIKHLYIH